MYYLLNFHLCSTEDKTKIVVFFFFSKWQELLKFRRYIQKKSFIAQEYLESVPARAASHDVVSYSRKLSFESE